jgi:hypothetical protein
MPTMHFVLCLFALPVSATGEFCDCAQSVAAALRLAHWKLGKLKSIAIATVKEVA